MLTQWLLPNNYRSCKDSIGIKHGELMDLIDNLKVGDTESKSQDVLGRVYEHFLGKFVDTEGKRSGQFFTTRSIVRVLAEMIEPYKGKVYDPCCGSGGMFVQSERFIEEHGGKKENISGFGQDSNQTTWKLSRHTILFTFYFFIFPLFTSKLLLIKIFLYLTMDSFYSFYEVSIFAVGTINTHY
jgi:hypothetical protein